MVEEAIANLIISIKTSAVELEHKAKLFKKYTKKTGQTLNKQSPPSKRLVCRMQGIDV